MDRDLQRKFNVGDNVRIDLSGNISFGEVTEVLPTIDNITGECTGFIYKVNGNWYFDDEMTKTR